MTTNANRHGENRARMLSLFAGIGGLELGLETAGVGHTVAQCEIEAFPRGVLAERWPDTERHEDVRDLTASDLGTIDLICGGFPCQDVSNAGKKAGIAKDTRSGLWYEYARLIRECRPSWVVIENVAALVSGGLGIVLADLSDAGYDCAWDCIPAAAVGAPHRRDRVFILAWRRDACSPRLDVSQAWRDAVDATRAKYGEADGAWPTPSASGGAGSRTLPEGTTETGIRPDGRKAQIGLQNAVRMWPTPTRADGAGGPGCSGRDGGDNLRTAVGGPSMWPTPRAEMDSGKHRGQPDALHSAVKTWPGWPAGTWPTPCAQEDGKSVEAHLAMKARMPGGTRTAITSLNVMVKAVTQGWPAGPRQAQHEWEPPRTAKGVKDRAKRLKALGNAVLPQAAEAAGLALLAIRDGAGSDDARFVVARLEHGRWAAPQGGLFGAVEVSRFPRAGTVRDGMAYELVPCAPLSSLSLGGATAGESWPTACATDAAGAARHTTTTGVMHSGTTLTDAVRMWPTPMSRDGKDTGDMARVNAREGRPADTLPRVVFQGGGDAAPLNPAWVEVLMGLPVGWTEMASRTRMREVA